MVQKTFLGCFSNFPLRWHPGSIDEQRDNAPDSIEHSVYNFVINLSRFTSLDSQVLLPSNYISEFEFSLQKHETMTIVINI